MSSFHRYNKIALKKISENCCFEKIFESSFLWFDFKFELMSVIFICWQHGFPWCTFLFRVSIKESSVAKLGSVCRRVYRIFSHAYYHHRSIFDEFETETCLCKRFTHFVTKYNLMSKDNLIVPILGEATTGESEA